MIVKKNKKCAVCTIAKEGEVSCAKLLKIRKNVSIFIYTFKLVVGLIHPFHEYNQCIQPITINSA